jgi:hypothetical protein
MFALLSGISSALTRDPKKRMLKTCGVTALFMGISALLHVIVPNLVKGWLIFNILAIISIGTIVEWLAVKIKHAQFGAFCAVRNGDFGGSYLLLRLLYRKWHKRR